MIFWVCVLATCLQGIKRMNIQRNGGEHPPVKLNGAVCTMCSSSLTETLSPDVTNYVQIAANAFRTMQTMCTRSRVAQLPRTSNFVSAEIGRESCRERVCQYV